MSSQLETSNIRADTSAAACECDHPVGSFMREMAHELGNIAFPLRMIIELQTRSAPLSTAELQEVLQNQVDALQSITRRLQTVGRSLSAAIAPEFAALSVLEVVKDAVDQQRQSAGAETAQLRVDCTGAAEGSLRGDRTLLVQALRELIDNAVRHSPPGGSVDLRVKSDSDSVEFLVSDEGPGISPEIANRMFRPFVTSRERLNFGTGQIGCGLALVRQVAAIHHGALDLRRTSASGSAFAMIIPAQGLPVR